MVYVHAGVVLTQLYNFSNPGSANSKQGHFIVCKLHTKSVKTIEQVKLFRSGSTLGHNTP